MQNLYDSIQTGIIFVLMGVFTVIVTISKSAKKLNLTEKFNLFYVNTVAGWGFFSLLISYDDWFGNFPQKVFTIMTVVYVGFNTLEFIKKRNLLGKIIEVFTKK